MGVGGFFKTFLEGSVDHIIYRNYIVNRSSIIYCSVTCQMSEMAAQAEKISSLRTIFNNDQHQRAWLRTFAGDDQNDIVDTFTEDQLHPGENQAHFDRLPTSMSRHFNPQTSVECRRFIFRHTEQKTDSTDETVVMKNCRTETACSHLFLP